MKNNTNLMESYLAVQNPSSISLTEALKPGDAELLADNTKTKFGEPVKGAHTHFKTISATNTELLFTDGKVVHIISKTAGTSIKVPLSAEMIAGFKKL